MAQFSARERLIANLLSSTPALKKFIKKIYLYGNYIVRHKNYDYRVVSDKVNGDLNFIEPIEPDEETFFGYYDKSPENEAQLILFNETKHPTDKKPTSNIPIYLYAMNITGNVVYPIDHSFSYNWQQGCRAQWLDGANLIYNFFDDQAKTYKSALFDINKTEVVKTFDEPVQDSFKTEYFLSINYERIMNLRPDYGYRNLPLLSDAEMNDLPADGIRMTDIKTGNSRLLFSLADICALEHKKEFKDSLHAVNHVMISPDGNRFIFIHRWYRNGIRHDRMIISDFSDLKVIADEDMVSHMCWFDNDTLFGYLRHGGKNGFYFIDIRTDVYRSCDALTDLHTGDGHPTVSGNKIVVDTYPDKSGMQHLILYDLISETTETLTEVRHHPKYSGETRCDMHPRFSPDGKRVYFDTVCSGKRRLAFIVLK